MIFYVFLLSFCQQKERRNKKEKLGEVYLFDISNVYSIDITSKESVDYEMYHN